MLNLTGERWCLRVWEMHICSHPEDYLRYSMQEGADTRNLMLKKYLKGLEEQTVEKTADSLRKSGSYRNCKNSHHQWSLPPEALTWVTHRRMDVQKPQPNLPPSPANTRLAAQCLRSGNGFCFSSTFQISWECLLLVDSKPELCWHGDLGNVVFLG